MALQLLLLLSAPVVLGVLLWSRAWNSVSLLQTV